MKKHVMSVGFEIPGNSVDFVDFKSSKSLLDADTIVFAPNIESYSCYERYEGKARMSDGDSARLVSDADHWRRELVIALESGKTVFVFMVGAPDVWVFSGRKEYAGTGRNARVTNIVVPFDPYSSIPLPGLVGSVQRRTGERIKPTGHLGLLAPYWQEFGFYTTYEAYLEKPIGNSALVTQTGEKMVGGIVRFKNWKGSVVLLPPPNFYKIVVAREKQLEEQRKRRSKTKSKRTDAKKQAASTRAEMSVEKQFLSAINEIDRTLKAGLERTPTPEWAQHTEYIFQEEIILKGEILKLDKEISELQANKVEVEAKLSNAGDLRGLLFETGKPLEAAILDALQQIGYAAETFKDEESEFDVVFADPDGTRFIGEVEGKNDKAVNIDKLAQLERNIQEDFKKREGNRYAGGVLFGNAFRLMAPAERGDFFTEKCLTGAKRSGVALVKTIDLFHVAKYLKENNDPRFAAVCRDAIKSTGGDVVKFPPIPGCAVPKEVPAPEGNESLEAQ